MRPFQYPPTATQSPGPAQSIESTRAVNAEDRGGNRTSVALAHLPLTDCATIALVRFALFR
jgi:hypothetical protein